METVGLGGIYAFTFIATSEHTGDEGYFNIQKSMFSSSNVVLEHK